MQMVAVGDDAPATFKLYVEVLYGVGNRAVAMPTRVTYTQKAQACEVFQRQMLRAAACGRLVRASLRKQSIFFSLAVPLSMRCMHYVCTSTTAQSLHWLQNEWCCL